MKLKHLALMTTLGMLLLQTTTPVRAVEADGTIVAASANADFGGLSMQTVEQKFKELFSIVGKNIGAKFSFKVMPELDVIKAFKAGKVDMFFSGVIYETAKANGTNPVPVAVIATKGDITQKVCMYVAGNSQFKTVKDLKGTVLRAVFSGVTTYPMLRKLMFDAGVNESPMTFFKGIKALPVDSKKAFQDVAAGQGSSILMLDSYKLYFSNDKLISSFRSVGCTPSFTQSFVMVSRNFDKTILEKLKTILLNGDKDPAFAGFKFLFIALQAKIKLVSEKDYASNLALYKEAEQKGWIAEMKKHTLPMERTK